MGTSRLKLRAKRGKGRKALMRKVKVKPYVGDETMSQKMRADSLQKSVDSLKVENDSLRQKIKEYEIQMKVEWKEKKQ